MEHEEIEITYETVLPAVQTLQGRGAGVKVGQLVEIITGRQSTPPDERDLRAVITQLRMAGHPVCATPADGYFGGVTDEEVWGTVRNLTRRSMTGLTQASKMTNRPIPDLVGQLAVEGEAA